ncbi:MAG: hypothetical protein AB4040_03505 [Synechococcus sp.]
MVTKIGPQLGHSSLALFARQSLKHYPGFPMNSHYRTLQLTLKAYRDAGFAVPALCTKYAKLLKSYHRIQASLQGQQCELPAWVELVPPDQTISPLRHASTLTPQPHHWRKTLYQTMLLVVGLPISLLVFCVTLPVFWLQSLRKSMT